MFNNRYMTLYNAQLLATLIVITKTLYTLIEIDIIVYNF